MGTVPIAPSTKAIESYSMPTAFISMLGALGTALSPTGTTLRPIGTKPIAFGTMLIVPGTKPIAFGTMLIVPGTKPIAFGTMLIVPGTKPTAFYSMPTAFGSMLGALGTERFALSKMPVTFGPGSTELRAATVGPVSRPGLLFIAAAIPLLVACVGTPTVERAYDGHVIDGRFIGPEAYAAFLRGASAEANGDVKMALAAYTEAARADPNGAEVWTRIGEVRCRADLRDAQADASFARALERDAGFARAWSAKAKCALARGDLAGARAAAQRAAALDSAADGANVLLAETAMPAQRDETRAALIALTMTAHDPVVAWDALATWSQTRGDVALWARALMELVRIAPARRESVARASEDLVGIGERWEARTVAAAAADADVTPLAGEHSLAARLAVDDAIARVDADEESRRATRVRLPLDEAAGRAMLAERRSLARELASMMVRADPGAVGAQWVLAVSSGGDVLAAPREKGHYEQVPSAAAFVAFAGALAQTMSPEYALAALGGLAHSPIVGGDDVVVRPAVELASRGAFAPNALPPDGVVELAALRGTAPPAEVLSRDVHALDARHEYLAFALAHPEAPRALELRARLAVTATSDPIIAAASALMDLAERRATTATASALLAQDPADPLLAATALQIAEKLGDEKIARRAREARAR
jgi:hypothetical protein